MKSVAFAAVMSVALTAAGMSVRAQTSTAAIPAAPPAGILQQGMVFKAVQSCPRFPGDGVSISVQSASPDGMSGSISVRVNCFDRKVGVGGPFTNGSITLRGAEVRVVFFTTFSTKFGGEWTGTWTVEGGKPVLRFGQSVLRAGDGPWTTPELVFR